MPWVEDTTELDLRTAEQEAEMEARYRVYCREFSLDPEDTESMVDYERDYRWWVKDAYQ
jgi:hypothetical protein